MARAAVAEAELDAESVSLQNHPDGVGAHFRQAVFRLSQRPLQCTERPGRRPVSLQVRFTPDFGQNAGLLDRPILDRRTTAVPRFQGRQPFLIEPRNQLRYGIIRTTSSGLGSRPISFSGGYSQQRFGSSYVTGWLTLSPSNLFKKFLFLLGERTEWVFSSAGHWLTSIWIMSTYPTSNSLSRKMAMSVTSDPLVCRDFMIG